MAVYFWNAARSEPTELPWELQRFYCTAWQDRIISVLHPWVHPQLSKQCTEISVTTSVSPTTNRGCETGKALPRFTKGKNPYAHKTIPSLRQLQHSGGQILSSFFGGWLLCHILQNSSSACSTVCACSLSWMQLGQTHKRCQGMGKTLLWRRACSEE